MDAIQIIKQYWGWAGIKPALLVERNQFGNLLVQDNSGLFWRICPEELTCEVVAPNQKMMQHLLSEDEFKQDWDMTGMVMLAYGTLGELGDEECYYFIQPPALGGEYATQNMGKILIADLIMDAGKKAEEKNQLNA